MIKFESIFKKEYSRAIILNQFRRLRGYMFVFSAILLGMAAILIFVFDQLVWGIVFGAVFGIGYIPFVYLFSKIAIDKLAIDAPLAFCDNAKQNYTFTDDNFTIEVIKQDETHKHVTDTLDYLTIDKVYESFNYFYIYFSDVTVAAIYTIPKNTLTVGTINEFISLLRKKLGKRFVEDKISRLFAKTMKAKEENNKM